MVELHMSFFNAIQRKTENYHHVGVCKDLYDLYGSNVCCITTPLLCIQAM